MPLRIVDDAGNEYDIQGEVRLVKKQHPVEPDPGLEPAEPEPVEPEPVKPEPVEPEPVEPEPQPMPLLDRLIDIAWGEHDALPEGAQTNWDWYRKGRGGSSIQGAHMNLWGQIFAVAGTTYDVDVELRGARMFFLRKNGTWYEPRPAQNPEPEGAYWNNRFSGVGRATVISAGGVYRVSLQPLARADAVTFHWWYDQWYPRVTVPPDVIGVCNVAEARLVGPNAGKAKMICSVAGDVWPVPTGGKPEGTQVSAMTQPRMTWLTSEWQLYGGVSYPKGTTDKPITKAMLRENPPPL